MVKLVLHPARNWSTSLAARITIGTNELQGGSVTEIMTVVEEED